MLHFHEVLKLYCLIFKELLKRLVKTILPQSSHNLQDEDRMEAAAPPPPNTTQLLFASRAFSGIHSGDYLY
jgi:hypothetical protein